MEYLRSVCIDKDISGWNDSSVEGAEHLLERKHLAKFTCGIGGGINEEVEVSARPVSSCVCKHGNVISRMDLIIKGRSLSSRPIWWCVYIVGYKNNKL